MWPCSKRFKRHYFASAGKNDSGRLVTCGPPVQYPKRLHSEGLQAEPACHMWPCNKQKPRYDQPVTCGHTVQHLERQHPKRQHLRRQHSKRKQPCGVHTTSSPSLGASKKHPGKCNTNNPGMGTFQMEIAARRTQHLRLKGSTKQTTSGRKWLGKMRRRGKKADAQVRHINGTAWAWCKQAHQRKSLNMVQAGVLKEGAVATKASMALSWGRHGAVV
eukprot:scaffold123561_cov24-Tisochrysis_lutea.AAC.1